MINEFDFAPRPTVKICGMEFDLDITDVGMISAVIDRYSQLTEQYVALKQAQEKMVGNEDLQIKLSRVEEANRNLYETSKGFITRVLGIDGYDAVFKGRKPNSVEHMQLCNFLYGQLLLNRNTYIEYKMQAEEKEEEDEEAL